MKIVQIKNKKSFFFCCCCSPKLTQKKKILRKRKRKKTKTNFQLLHKTRQGKTIVHSNHLWLVVFFYIYLSELIVCLCLQPNAIMFEHNKCHIYDYCFFLHFLVAHTNEFHLASADETMVLFVTNSSSSNHSFFSLSLCWWFHWRRYFSFEYWIYTRFPSQFHRWCFVVCRRRAFGQ